MSRSLRASTKSLCFSFALLTWVVTGMMLVLATSPALALDTSASQHHRGSAASAARGASQARPTTPTTHKSDPPPGGGSHTAMLTLGTGYGTTHGSAAVKALQRHLIGLGFSPGPVDGRYGPLTEHAVIAFQAAHGLRTDGIAGPLTLAALTSAKPTLQPGDGYTTGGSQSVRNLQRALAAAGFAPGHVDGRYGPLTEGAVRRYQAARHLQIDGVAGPQTLGRLQASAPRAHHQTPRPSTPPRATHPKTTNPAPGARATKPQSGPTLPKSNTTPGRTTTSTPAPQKVSSKSTVPIGWIIALCFVLGALLVAAVLTRRPGRGDRVRDSNGKSGRRPSVSQFRRGIRARRDVPELVPIPVDLKEHAAEQLLHAPGNGGEEQPAGAPAFRLGLLLVQDGNLVGAEDAFRRADDNGHPGAAFELAVLLTQEGDRAGAKEAFGRAEERGHPEAAFGLGVLLAEEGDRADAKQAFQRALERDHHPDAAFNLGSLLIQENDVAAAENAFRIADQSGDAGAACNLGVLLEQRGDSAAAKEAYQRADDRGHAVGACNLGALLEYDGDLAGARRAYERADSRGDPIGSYNLGLLLEREGDRDAAKNAYRRADQRGNPEAACNLGLMLKQEGDREGALEAFRRAGEHGSQDVAEVARAEMLELTGAGEAER